MFSFDCSLPNFRKSRYFLALKEDINEIYNLVKNLFFTQGFQNETIHPLSLLETQNVIFKIPFCHA